ncbi:SprT family zinc-dependent metalloprotease [Marinomonas balearica]|uniref:SprT family zinc-dependent metalloprotease n=1 Tax=Marinomonas balearica TaxID=491947 RepID=UPI001FB6FD44|nr:SprT family zinc-dependent metalloprotease [Marinomonas balearica]
MSASNLGVLVDHDRVESKIFECMNIASRYFRVKLSNPSFNFKQRGRAAGTAYLQKNEIRLNSYMYEQSPDEFLNNVVPHEVAHIVVFQIYGLDASPHGKEWKAIMEHLFGVPANRTHNFKLPPRKNGYKYKCSCSVHEFTAHRHSRARKGTEYICRLCKTTLKYVENSDDERVMKVVHPA